MTSNYVWNLVELPNGVKAIRCKWVFKTKRDFLGNIERQQDSLPNDSLKGKESITKRPFLLYLRNIFFK